MSEPLLNVMKIMLLAGLYLFFVRVLWSVFSELRSPTAPAADRHKERTPTRTARSADSAVPSNAVPPVVPAVVGSPPAGVALATAVGQLVVIEPTELAGSAYTIGTAITLGRAHTNGIAFDDTYVSTVHARIFATNGTYFVEDLDSRNGSSLNGQELVETTALTPGDRLQVGSIVMEFS